MTLVDLPAPSAAPRRVNLGWVVMLLLTVVHFGWLTAHLAPAIMSPDANGYVVQARAAIFVF